VPWNGDTSIEGVIIIIIVKPTHDREECPEFVKWIKVATHKKDDVLIGTYYRIPKSPFEALEQLDSLWSIAKIFESPKYKKCKIFLWENFNLGDINWTIGCSTKGVLVIHWLGPVRSNLYLRVYHSVTYLWLPSLVEKVFICPPIGLSNHDILFIRTPLNQHSL
jgi:hypothetical protein